MPHGGAVSCAVRPISGGATGIALGINRALGLPVSGVLFVINMTMLTVGWVLLGRRFAITTIASTVLSPLFLALWERVFTGFVLTDDWCSTPFLQASA